jgi:hypothetical protein
VSSEGNGEIRKLQDEGFNDRVPAFRWIKSQPFHEVIQSITIPETDQQDEESTQKSTVLTNDADRTSSITASFAKEQTTQITTSTTDTYVTGIRAKHSASAEAGVGIVKATVGWKVEAKFDYTHEESKSYSETTTTKFGSEHPVKVPARSKQRVNVTFHTSRVNSKTYTTKAERWYARPVFGWQRDNTYSDAPYKRNETVQITVAGGLRGNIEVHFGKVEKL